MVASGWSSVRTSRLCTLRCRAALRHASMIWLRQIVHNQVNNAAPPGTNRVAHRIDHRHLHHILNRHRVERAAAHGKRDQPRRVGLEKLVECPLIATLHPADHVAFIQHAVTSRSRRRFRLAALFHQVRRSGRRASVGKAALTSERFGGCVHEAPPARRDDPAHQRREDHETQDGGTHEPAEYRNGEWPFDLVARGAETCGKGTSPRPVRTAVMTTGRSRSAAPRSMSSGVQEASGTPRAASRNARGAGWRCGR